MPSVRNDQATIDHRCVRSSHADPWSDCAIAEMANANGTDRPTYPMYNMGGWTAIRMWFCSSGFGPNPSRGAEAAASGSHDELAHPTPPAKASVHTRKGFEAVAMSPNQKTTVNPSTARAPMPSRSPSPTVRPTHHTNPTSTRPHNTMLPSSAAHADASRNTTGVDRLVFWATYSMEKSWPRMAASSATKATMPAPTTTAIGTRSEDTSPVRVARQPR